MKSSLLSVWFHTSRPKTLLVSVAPVVLGTSLTIDPSNFFSWLFLIILLTSISIQIIANLVNDLWDDQRGADGENRLGPKRGLQTGALTRKALERATIFLVCLSVLLGASLVYRGGWPILAIGLAAIFSAFAYTAGKNSLAYTGFADIFVFIFFGPVAVAGTQYLFGLRPGALAIVMGFSVGALATAILVVNNLRDVEEDRAASKNTLTVRFGKRFSKLEYAALLILPALGSLWLYSKGLMGIGGLLALAYLIPAYSTLKRVMKEEKLNQSLERTAQILLGFSLLSSFGILAL